MLKLTLAFKEMDAAFPLYGKHASPPLTPGEWWTRLIHKCMAHAGASERELAECGERMSASLLARFESQAGYSNFPETLDTCESLAPHILLYRRFVRNLVR